MHLAATIDDEKVGRLLLDAGIDQSMLDNQSGSALHTAATMGHTSVIKLLLDAGAEVSCRDMDGHTALYWAALSEGGDAVQLIIDHGASIEKFTEDAFSQAAEASQLRCRSISKDSDGSTALHRAAGATRLAVVDMLLSYETDISLKNAEEKTPYLSQLLMDMRRLSRCFSRLVQGPSSATPMEGPL